MHDVKPYWKLNKLLVITTIVYCGEIYYYLYFSVELTISKEEIPALNAQLLDMSQRLGKRVVMKFAPTQPTVSQITISFALDLSTHAQIYYQWSEWNAEEKESCTFNFFLYW